MSFLGKLKTIKRKWIILTVVILAVVLAGGIAAACFHERFEDRNGEHKDKASYQTYYDLLYLQNTTDMKITPDQAKAIEPLLEKLSATTDKTTIKDLESNIYKQLTPEQYYSLINSGNNIANGKNFERNGRERGGFGRGEGKGEDGGMSGTIKDVVIKMLKDISSK